MAANLPLLVLRPELEAAAVDVIETLKKMPEFASCRVAVIGGLALWKYIPDGRTTEDVDFIINIDTAQKPIKPKLLSLPNSNFTERAQFFYYEAPNGRLIQIDIVPFWQSPYLPSAAAVVSTIPKGTIPYISATDLILFKINCCGLRADSIKKRRDATDAVALLEQETKSGPLSLSPEQKSAVRAGIDDVVLVSGRPENWWTQRLGM